jgi:hypothetical protein
MPVSPVITTVDFQILDTAISAYADEAYTSARKLNDTGIVGTDNQIDASGEGYAGQFRWFKTMNPVINTPDLDDATPGTFTGVATDVASFIKAVRSYGASQVNLQSLITRADGLAKVARDFVEHRAQEESDAILAVLKGVAAAEAARASTSGILNFDTDPDSAGVGFLVDINANSEFGAAATSAATTRKLFDASASGAARGERLFRAIGMAWKDLEAPYYYMITSPSDYAELRAANLIDDTTVTEGNLEFQTIFNGKFRLILTRLNTGSLASSSNVNNYSTKTTFVIRPGTLAWQGLNIDMPVETDRDPRSFKGSGSSQIWYRWGYVVHPRGYDWSGPVNGFATHSLYGTASSWTRKMKALNLGILPILHG